MRHRILLAAILLCCSAGAARAQFSRTEDLRVRPPEAWQPHSSYGLNLGLGGGYLNGNVRSKSFYGTLELDWKPAERNSIFVQASDNYVKYGDSAVTDKSKGSLLYAYGARKWLNLFLQTTHSHDKFRSVSYRMTNTAGVCFHNFLPGPLKPVMISAGLTPEYEESGGGASKRDFRATARLNFAMPLTDTVKLSGDVIYAPRTADTGNYRIYSEDFLEFKVWKDSVVFRITATDEYDSRPYPGVKRNDFGLNHSLVVKFSD
ncbi:MAG: DUF481 domain-containing protein [Elusimicrobia bacterium]|nr:DUF481 domain-containing protein [Elusimicrobiota bacterium]